MEWNILICIPGISSSAMYTIVEKGLKNPISENIGNSSKYTKKLFIRHIFIVYFLTNIIDPGIFCWKSQNVYFIKCKKCPVLSCLQQDHGNGSLGSYRNSKKCWNQIPWGGYPSPGVSIRVWLSPFPVVIFNRLFIWS